VKRTFWITLAGLIAFTAILVARLPASWLVPSGPKVPFACAGIEGTLWSGACSALSIQQQPVGDLTWELHPLKLFTATLAAGVTLSNAAARASGELELTWHGLTARDFKAQLPLDPKLLPGLPPQLRGDAQLDLALARITRGVITEVKGKLEAHNLEDRAGHVTPLGSYVITFPGGQGEPVGQVRDLGGPLSVEGTVKLTREGGYDVECLVAARPEASPELAGNLRYLGSPDASGRRTFALSGTF
jgi:general secretion pathway protein N